MEQKSASSGASRVIVTEPAQPTVKQIEAAIAGVVGDLGRVYRGRRHTLQELQEMQAEVNAVRRVTWAVGTVTRGMDDPIDELDRLWISIDNSIVRQKSLIRQQREMR